jgi:2'-5' RNA ligase
MNHLRTILLFPQFENMHEIYALRKAYDPLFDKIAPHITLVFPFESAYKKEEIEVLLAKQLKEVTPFSVTLQGLSVAIEYLFLNVTSGERQIISLHETLYTGILQKHRHPRFAYVPHMTIGRFETAAQAQQAYEKEQEKSEHLFFSGMITHVYVETIGAHEASSIEIAYKL